jgi:dTDP-glucose 4,6-dehydratase
MRILLAGGAGFLGSHLTERLLDAGHDVTVLDNLSTGRERNLVPLMRGPASGRLRLIRADVARLAELGGRFDAVLHLASPASPRDYQRDPIGTLEAGSLGTRNLLELACRQRARFLLASTSEVYGDPDVHPQHEEYWGRVNPVGPRSMYDEAKRFSEALATAYARDRGLKVRIARIFNTYGPRMRVDDGRVIPTFVAQALRGEPLTVYGDGSQTRSYCYVSDLVAGLEKLLWSEVEGPVNIGNPREFTVLETAQIVLEVTKRTNPIVHRPAAVDDPCRRRPDIRRARRVLDWEPIVPLETGLAFTVADLAPRVEPGVPEPAAQRAQRRAGSEVAVAAPATARAPLRPAPAWPYLLMLAAWGAGSAAIARSCASAWSGYTGHAAPLVAGLEVLVALAEMAGLFYLLGFVAKSFSYLVGRSRPDADARARARPTAVLYLTAGDFDAEAVDSLLRLGGDGPRLFVLHDDGEDAEARVRMREFVDGHPCRAGWEIEVWHRPRRVGGKAGAVNWVVERLDPRWELLLLCDSDSIALAPDALARAGAEFEDPAVAVVQFRNAGHAAEDAPHLERTLASAIDVYDAFAEPQSRWGYLPFFGHNALLRLADLRSMGLTPGFFSDDLDLSARLTLAGRRVVYRSDIAFGERHPSDWAAFRKRARKWAFGCMQVVRARGRDVLTRRGVPLAHRLGLLEFMGFYPAQALFVAGCLARHIVLPLLGVRDPASGTVPLAGTAIALALLAPTFAWSVRARRLREWPALAWACVLVYGGSVLATVRGVLDGLSRRERPWVPTNLGQQRPAVPVAGLAEAVLGILVLGVPWLLRDPLADSPASWLFAATLAFSPLTFAFYRETRRAAARPAAERARRPLQATAAVLIAVTGMVWLYHQESPRLPGFGPGVAWGSASAGFHVEGGRLMRAGHPFVVRGVFYSPWQPGTGPGHGPYPTAAVVERDLAAIAQMGANTIEVQDAPAWVIDAAQRQDLATIYVFHIAWNDTSRSAFEAQAASIDSIAGSLATHPGIVAWILGHEVPAWVVDRLGARAVEGRLRELADRVRQRDPWHLLGHANWPATKQLDLSFLDLACFNLYPAWPYEVSVKGFGPYLRDVLVPLARGRPLLVTEFGINALEASEARQARVLQDCWRDIVGAHVAGGVAFEWCDEWWKNYDNPIPGRGYWERSYAPDDAARHDDDPEEYYGIVRGDRTPRPALEALRIAWRGQGLAPGPWVGMAVLAAATLAVLGRGATGRRQRGASGGAAGMVSALVAFLLLGASPRACRAWAAADTLTGLHANDQFGWALAGLGDVNGDGLGDAGLGARFALVGVDTAAGVVYVYRGGWPQGSAPYALLTGRSADEHFGESLCGGADIDGDGRPDVAVGAPMRAAGVLSAAGAVDLFRGGALGAGRWATLAGEAANDWFGESVALGDLDGDGVAEIIVGAPYNDRAGSAAGAVFIYRGGSTAPSAPWKVLVGQAANDQFGWSVAAVGDVDGDGYGDVVVGARLHGLGPNAAAGAVYLFRGGPTMDTIADRVWNGEAKDDWFGNSVAGPGDVDGGGRADVLVGAPYNDRGGSAAGAAYLFRGEDAPGSPPAAIYTGQAANAQFGWSVARAGDVNGDGRPDVVVGARMQPSGALAAAGRAYVFAGGIPLSSVAIATADGEAADDWFGNAVGECGGYFTAGRGPLYAGAPYNDATASAAGRAYLLGTTATVAVDPMLAGDDGRARARPNPARGPIEVTWGRAAIAAQRVEVRDLAGRRLRLLPCGPTADGGGSARWDGRDEKGRAAPDGLYFVRGLGRDGAQSFQLRLVLAH